MSPEIKLFLDVERAILSLYGWEDTGVPHMSLRAEGTLHLALFSRGGLSLSGVGSHEDEAILALLERAYEAKTGSDFNVYVDLSEKGRVWLQGSGSEWVAEFCPHGSQSTQMRRVQGRSDDACILRLWLDLRFSYN